jgi:two-component system OmpR family sensor kinase
VSLRLRLLIGLGVVALVVVAVAAYVVTSTRDDLLDRVDAQLRVATGPGPDVVGPAPGASLGGPAPAGEGSFATVDEVGPVTLWVGIISGGEVQTLFAPPSGGDGTMIDVPLLDEDDIAALVEDPGRPRTVDGRAAKRFRVLSERGPGDATTVVGASLHDVDNSVYRLAAVVVVGTAVALVALGTVAVWVLRLGVRPLKRMTATASDIAAGDLSQRVPAAEPGTEAGDLADALNGMLGRLEEAFSAQAASEARLRRFVADASHELRTPITTIRGYAELHRQGALDDPEARRAAMARTEQEAVRMGALVEDLLLLARLDQGRPLARDRVDLVRLAEDARDDAAAAHPDHPVEVTVDGGGVVTGDEDRLRQVVANLVANATTHTPTGTHVTLSVVGPPDADEVRLLVADEGPGMAPDVAARAFERFSRGDAARTRASGSTGLGLSIVEAIVEAHGGSVELRSAPGDGTTVEVALPRVPPDGPGGRAPTRA